MDKIRRFICVLVPTTACNLRCRYCYLRYGCSAGQRISDFPYDPKTFRKGLSRMRLGGTCMFNFTADGETLIDLKLLDYVEEILAEGHYVELITNATIVPAFDRIASFPPEYLDRLMLKCSFHYLELKERNLLDTFFGNIRKVRDAGASFSVELMPHDELIPFRQEIYDLTVREVGAPCHLTVGRDPSDRAHLPLLTKLSRKEYAQTWSMFDSKMFEYKLSVFGQRQTGFCYAGDWMMLLNMGTGKVQQCYSSCRTVDIFADIDAPPDFKAIGNHCLEPHCFNAHAWLTFGCIPMVDAPCYDEMRNRRCADGSEWLKPRLKAFFHQKFADNNPLYGPSRRLSTNVEMTLRCVAAMHPVLLRAWRLLKWVLKSGKTR